MLQLTYPGVYTQEKSSGVRTIVGASTSVAHFIGPTRTGIDNRPIRCLNYGDFERQFGGLDPQSSLSYSVLHFFANGGSQAFVTRVPVENADPARSVLAGDGTGATALTLTALGSGRGRQLDLRRDRLLRHRRRPVRHGPRQEAVQPHRARLPDGPGRALRQPDDRLRQRADGRRRRQRPGHRLQLVRLTMTPADPAGPARRPASIYKFGAGPATATIAADLKLALSVTRRAADGTADAGQLDQRRSRSRSSPSGGTGPDQRAARSSPALVSAINQKVRATPAGGGETGRRRGPGRDLSRAAQFFRLSLTRPVEAAGTARIHDATVTFVGPAGGTVVQRGLQHRARRNAAHPRQPLALPARPGRTRAATISATRSRATTAPPHGQPVDAAFKNAVQDLEAPRPVLQPAVPARPGAPPTDRPAGRAPRQRRGGLRRGGADLRRRSSPSSSSTHRPTWSTSAPPRRGSRPCDRASPPATPAAWFPRIRVDDPLQPGSIISHPPSGAIAGVIARTDAQVGVWQAPAGTEAVLAGVYGPAVAVSDAEHGLLNPLGLNVIRQFPIYQTVAFGSRTVDGSNALGSEWKYIPVQAHRRTTSCDPRRSRCAGRCTSPTARTCGRSCGSAARPSCTACTVRAPSRAPRPRQAYFVACDASTTTQADIDAGSRQHRRRLRPAEAGRVRRHHAAPDRAAGGLREAADMGQFSVNAQRLDPYKNFKFRVKWDGRYVAGVSKVSLLKRTTEVVKHRSGGDPSTSFKSPGRTEYDAITLERGVTHDQDFEQWANKVWNFGSGLGGEVSLADFRKDIIVELLNEAGQVVLVLRRLPVLGLGVPGAARPRRQRERRGHRQAQARERGLGARLRRGRAQRAHLRRALSVMILAQRGGPGPLVAAARRRPPTSGCAALLAALDGHRRAGGHPRQPPPAAAGRCTAVVGTPLEAVVACRHCGAENEFAVPAASRCSSCRRRSHRPSWRSR